MVRWRNPLIIAIGALLGGVFAAYFGFPLAVHEPDYVAHLGIVRRLLDGTLPYLPYNGIIGSHLLLAAVMKLTGFTGHQATSLLFWIAQGLMLSILYVAPATSPARIVSRSLAIGAYALGSSLLVTMLLFRGYLPQIYSWPAYAAAYISFFVHGRRIAGLVLLFLAAVIYPDGLLWMLPVFVWYLPLDPRPARIVRGMALALVTLFVVKQLSHAGLEGGANTGWFESGALFSFILCSGFLLIRRRESLPPLARILALYLLIAGGVALHAYLTEDAVKYYARKNFYFMGVLFPLMFVQLPAVKWRRIALAVSGVLFILSLTRMNGVGADVAVRELMRGSPTFDAADERLANLMQTALPADCQGVVVLPGFQAKQGYREDPYIELLMRTFGYNSWLSACSLDGSIHRLEPPYSNFYELARLLRHNQTLDLMQLPLRPGSCVLVSERYSVTGATCSGTDGRIGPERETFRLCRRLGG